MNTARAVTVIPASATRFEPAYLGIVANKRVAAYARVSTDTEEQLSSYEAQVDYYTRYIQENESWDFVEVYTDEGISATSTKKRAGFNRMVKDAMDGKIDMIITKSVSRFARNTVDTLINVRKLKEKGVEVFFEKENIYTLDSKGELLITIMSSLAQQESANISENVKWGQRKRFADGQVNLPYKQFLGYEKGENGLPKIVESEAKTVRLIYRMYLEGKTPSGIAKHLTQSGIPTPAGKETWPPSTVKSILTNEKFSGNAKLQKSFTVDFLTKKKKINEGEVPQYFVENSHPAIISPKVFDMVQLEMNRRKESGVHYAGTSCFSSKIVCGECGNFYGSKVWHSTSKYRREVWQCNHKFNGPSICGTPHFVDAALKRMFIDAFNRLIEIKDEVMGNCELICQMLTDTSDLDKETESLQREIESVTETIRQYVDENARSTIDQTAYQKRYLELAAQYEKARIEFERAEEQRKARRAQQEQIYSFLDTLKQNDLFQVEFNDELWYSVIDKVTVYSSEDVRFAFKDGSEIKITE